MKELIFKIVIKNEIELDLKIDEIRKFPTYNSLYSIFEEKMIIIEYDPAIGFDEDGFIELMKPKIKSQFKAHSIEVVKRKTKEVSE